MDDCVFCAIRKGEIPSTKVYEDKDFVPYLDMMTDDGAALLGKILLKISKMQEELGITEGYRLVINQGDNAGQTVNHVHIHIMGGEKLKDL